MTDLEKLRAFAQDVMEFWPDGAGYGGELQDIAELHGLLVKTYPKEPCGEHCYCLEYYDRADFDTGDVICYRRTALLEGK